jgi:tripartite ATP-independent transporter DctM subunit
MNWVWSAVLLFGAAIALMGIGLPVAFAFLLCNLIAVLIYVGDLGHVSQIVLNGTSVLTNAVLVSIPLFLLKGSLLFRSGVAGLVFDTIDRCVGNFHGRLAYLAVVVGVLYASITGSGMATTAMLGSLLVGEMAERGYKSQLTMGPILGVGGLAMIIPPAALAVLLGSLGKIDIANLLVAGLVPALILAIGYLITIRVQLWIDPSLAPAYSVERVPLGTVAILLAKNVLPVVLVIAGMVGFLMEGIATPSESAAFGCVGMLLLCIFYRKLRLSVLTYALQDALLVTGVVFFLILSSSTFSQMLAFSGAAGGIVNWASHEQTGATSVVVIMIAVVIFLGFFMDAISIMPLCVPVFMPVVFALKIDEIWFGIIMLVCLEVGTIHPPFGIHLFIMKSLAPRGTTFKEIVYAAIPFVVCDLIAIAIFIAFPSLTSVFR